MTETETKLFEQNKQLKEENEKLKQDVRITAKANKTLSDALHIVEEQYAETLVSFYDAIKSVVPNLDELSEQWKNLAANVEIARRRELAIVVLNQLMSKEKKANGRKSSKK